VLPLAFLCGTVAGGARSLVDADELVLRGLTHMKISLDIQFNKTSFWRNLALAAPIIAAMACWA